MGSLHRRRVAISRYYGRLREASEFGIGPNDLVLDLGSGQDPHPRANVLCDKFVADSAERSCGAGLLVDRPFVLADAVATPFPDKSFDFVICSHLLEHMEDPEALLTELQRIGKRGYIETPSGVYEKLWGWRFHKWFVDVENDTLILRGKDRVIFDDDLHEWFSGQIEREDVWKLFMPQLQELGLLTTLVWEDAIPYRVEGKAAPDTEGFLMAKGDPKTLFESATSVNESGLTMTQSIKSAAARMIRRSSDARGKELLQSLICPRCRVPLGGDSASRKCPQCGSAFPIVGSVHMGLASDPESDESALRLGAP